MARDSDRPFSLAEHPLYRRSYRVPTPSIAKLRALVEECLFLFVSGALVHGRPRIGKSYGIEFMRQDLEHRHPKVSVYKIRCLRSQSPSEGAFFASLLHAARHPAQSGTSRSALRGRLIHRLRQVAESKGDARIVLFADEAQNLREIEYEWLREIHDDLENNDIRLFTFLVGQTPLLAQKSALQAQDKEQIVARFMVEELPFRGIASAAECSAVLKAYDLGEFPAASGWTYTRFCLPLAWSAGLRLEESGGRLWSAFEDAHVKAGLDGNVEVPMKYFTTAVEAALLLSTHNDGETLNLDARFWESMVQRSRYVMARHAGQPSLSAIPVR